MQRGKNGWINKKHEYFLYYKIHFSSLFHQFVSVENLRFVKGNISRYINKQEEKFHGVPP